MERDNSLQRAQLLHGLVRLSAALAVVDGEVTREEFFAFRLLFPLPPNKDLRVRGWWQEAVKQPPPPELAGSTVLPIFRDMAEMREEVLMRWVALALADKAVTRPERAWLLNACRALQLSPRILVQILQESPGGKRSLPSDPYVLLGVQRSTPMSEIRAAWQQALRIFHPDAIAAQGLGVEQQQRFGKRMAEINAAYDRIKSERGN